MRRRVLLVSLASALTVVSGAGTQGASGDVVAESKDFRLIDSVTLGGVAVGGRVVGDTYFVSSWQTGLSAYDVSDPKRPELLDHMGADEIHRSSRTRMRISPRTARSCSCPSSIGPMN